MVNDLKKYRTAKKLVSDLEKITSLMNEAKSNLKGFIHYYPVRATLENLIRNQEILTTNLKRQKQVIANKGAIDGTKATIKA